MNIEITITIERDEKEIELLCVVECDRNGGIDIIDTGDYVLTDCEQRQVEDEAYSHLADEREYWAECRAE